MAFARVRCAASGWLSKRCKRLMKPLWPRSQRSCLVQAIHPRTIATHALLRCRVSRVLLPICFLAGILNYLDRTNLTFAALQLNSDLGFTLQASI